MKILYLLRFQIRCLQIHASRKSYFCFSGLLSLIFDLSFHSKINFCQNLIPVFSPFIKQDRADSPFVTVRFDC